MYGCNKLSDFIATPFVSEHLPFEYWNRPRVRTTETEQREMEDLFEIFAAV